MQRAPAARNALLIPTPPPIRKTSLRQLDSGWGRLLRLLVEPVQGQQHLSAAAFLRKQDAVDDPIAVHSDLPYVAVKMAGGPQTSIANLLHAGEHSRRVGVGELVDEPFDRTTTRCGPVVAPAPPNRRRPTGSGVGLLPGSLRWSHRTSLCSASDRVLLVSRTGPNPGPSGVEKRETPRVHGAQAYSGTGTRTLVVSGGWQASKESAYVEASRARQGTDWFVSREDLGVEGHDTERIQRLAQNMRRSHAQTPSLAHPELPDRDYGPRFHHSITPSRTGRIPGIVRTISRIVQPPAQERTR